MDTDDDLDAPRPGLVLLAAPQGLLETLPLPRLQGQGCERAPPTELGTPATVHRGGPRWHHAPRVSPGTDDGGLAGVASVAPTGSEGSRLCMTRNNQRRPLPCDVRIPRSQIQRPQLRFAAAATPVGSVFQASTEEPGREPEAPRGWLAVPSPHAPAVGVPEQLTRDCRRQALLRKNTR